MKRTALFLLSITTALMLWASPSKERAEALYARAYAANLHYGDESPVLSLIHEAYLESEETKITLEYSDSALSFSSLSPSSSILVTADKDETRLFVDGERIGKENIRKSADLILPSLVATYSALEDQSLFSTKEKLTYIGEDWATTVTFPKEERDAEIEFSFLDGEGSSWRVWGTIQNDKIPLSFSPLTPYRLPYFKILGVLKNGEERNPIYW